MLLEDIALKVGNMQLSQISRRESIVVEAIIAKSEATETRHALPAVTFVNLSELVIAMEY